MLSKDSKIYIAGHHGLVGSAIWNNLKKRGYNNLVGRSHKELDLTDQYAVEKFFDEELLHAMRISVADYVALHLHVLHDEVCTIQ